MERRPAAFPAANRMKKALAICGSPRVEGNTEILLKAVLKEIEEEGFEVELIRLAGKTIKPCIACGNCAKGHGCVQRDDDFQDIFQVMVEADAIILGTPVYFGSATSQLMALIQRAGYVDRKGSVWSFSRKIGAPVVVARRAGHNFTLAQLMYFFTLCDMVVPGSTYWNIGIGRDKGDVLEDAEGMKTMARLGKNIAWLLRNTDSQGG
jgi:multimeric flavodoxin WrbA